MHTIARTIPAATLALAVAVLTGCGSTPVAGEPARGQEADVKRLTKQALTYVGDPWEKRFRTQFWSGHHIHDSWNPCHIGENLGEASQGGAPDCWSRLPAGR